MSRSLKKGPYINVALEKKIIAMNEKGTLPEKLEDFAIVNQKKFEDDSSNYSMDELKHLTDA